MENVLLHKNLHSKVRVLRTFFFGVTNSCRSSNSNVALERDSNALRCVTAFALQLVRFLWSLTIYYNTHTQPKQAQDSLEVVKCFFALL